MELCSIASGSSGNCIYAGTDQSHILVDAGISGKRIEAGLNEIGLKTEEIQGILVTHEHVDHIKSLGVLARKYGIPIYATAGTIQWITERQAIGKVDESLFHPVVPEQDFKIGDLTVCPLRTSHDAAEPVAYMMKNQGKSMAVLTDLGKYDDYLVDKLQGLDVLLLEANHDVHMLEVGGYPYYLKKRILGDRGHLSNELSGQLLGRLLHDKFQKVVLGHLSKENNYPQLAYEAVRLEITMGDSPYKGSDFPIQVAKRDQVSELVCV
ncbi:putative hydrolase [uncultured Roseburia sp.]|uniref:MBL fold metallo-hydrolase n=1 Tax=Brotonthovivens ammoniilytica TaxID=2981725 RepID=A0ABT2TN03_9FIRM|nr:MBL fold metallo-hydrolase [Brotonthovivens ammoniilytica]MCU6763482.1 MBL fold metallo-hydrolase [Brotonthovivens ammoniilytica]SCJ20864.1 putative hydrolase [uncultured Roseburia sp.]